MSKVVNVKINGELVSSDNKYSNLLKVHLCGNYCPMDVMMTCLKVRTSGNLPIEEYPFITDGIQVLGDKRIKITKKDGSIRYVKEAESLIVSKCLRYEKAIGRQR